ncbi:2575_t:CDS:2 [Entrophospora sp. SA101]|nr:2575_t:CDS:2 [Entrophospora sp. SA101]CAJ0840507.1 11939_t:CDS:2 [Entrophospora sp. SA101]
MFVTKLGASNSKVFNYESYHYPTYNFECFSNLLTYDLPISPSSESQLIKKASFPEQLTVSVGDQYQQ